jgi:hypothetical protein
LAISVGDFGVDDDNRLNESLTIEDNGLGLHVRALGMRFAGAQTNNMSPNEAAEYFWGIFFDPLRRH